MLNEDDEEYLYEKVVAVLRIGDPITALGTCLPTACMDQIPRNFSYIWEYARKALELCKADGWNNNPCWILSLFDLFPEEPRSLALKQRLAVPPAIPKPEHARVLVSEIPFLNRGRLRHRATSLAADRVARPILLVTGEKRGKSYSYEYIYHLFVTNWLKFTPFRVRFDAGVVFDPERLARAILTGMGVAVNRLPEGFFSKETNNVRWTYDLANKVLAERPAGKRFWIILDNFVGKDVLPETAKFIDGLARSIVDSAEMAQAFRLVLLNFERARLTVESFKVEGEEIMAVTDEDVIEGVREIFERFQGPPAKPLLDGTLAKIFQGLPTTAKRVDEINGRLQVLIDTLRN